MFSQLFERKPLIGMVHLLPLPGAPGYGGNIRLIEEAALADMRALERGGADAFILENFGDTPYPADIAPPAFAAMAVIGSRLAREARIPFGVNVQFNCAMHEWALACALEADFIRVEAFVENRVGVHGAAMACAPALARLRAQFPAKALVFADINTKHTFPLVDQPLDFSIHEAAAAGADALIVTGLRTGENPGLTDVRELKRSAGGAPVLLGSGVTVQNAADFFAAADGAIVGSWLKKDGNVLNPVDESRVRAFCDALHAARAS